MYRSQEEAAQQFAQKFSLEVKNILVNTRQQFSTKETRMYRTNIVDIFIKLFKELEESLPPLSILIFTVCLDVHTTVQIWQVDYKNHKNDEVDIAKRFFLICEYLASNLNSFTQLDLQIQIGKTPKA